MIQYPLSFRVQAKTPSGVSTPWMTSVPGFGSELTAAIPPEFEGPGGGYSPEDFYALAILNCFAATFKVIAGHSKLDYESLALEGTLTVDRNEKGAPWMKHFVLRATLTAPNDPDRAKRILEKTSQSCIVLNSVKTEKEFQFEIR
jgi:uncharacterized OsmC-like protein